MKDLEDYPYLSYDQGLHNSFYFSEEMMSQIPHPNPLLSVIEQLCLI